MDAPMTFADLNLMVEYWSTDLNENVCTFQNQTVTINSLFWKQEEHNTQFEMIEKKLACLNYFHGKTEFELLQASKFTKILEDMILKLENSLTANEEMDDIDASRELYGLFEKTYINLNCFKNEAELIIKEIKSIEKKNAKNAMEHIGKIMEALLKSLYFVESKILSMQNRIQSIDQQIRSIVCEERGLLKM